MSEAPKAAPIPRTFMEYVRAMGPGIVVVLTWLGAGDIVDSAVAGGSYGYALMWVMALALAIRWMFVSTIAKFQLCNERGETLLQGLQRLHRGFPPFILVAAVIFAHIINAYMYQGLGESLAALTGFGLPWMWALGFAFLMLVLVRKPSFRRIEIVFMVFLALLSVSLLTAALWSGPDPLAILRGTFGFQLPEARGDFDAMLVGVSLVGAVAGSLANLMYPYFIREKGWTTPAHRKIQLYDLAFGVLIVIVLDLSVWALGAEVMHPKGLTISSIKDLAQLLGNVMGHTGTVLIYIGVFAAVGSSILGNALAYGYMATDALLLWKPVAAREEPDYRKHPFYHGMTYWALFTPLVWVMSGQTSFIALTVAVNAFQVLLLPILAWAVWILTANPKFIGEKYKNRLWENAGMLIFVVMAGLGAYGAVTSLVAKLSGG
jgi:Mn2+/Fe2+ NRAMP family transporter